MIPPGLSHALIALAVQAAVAAPLAIWQPLPWALGIGGAVAVAGYIGRERRQSEEHYGGNRIPLWWWKPRAGRDVGWPALAVAVPFTAATIAG